MASRKWLHKDASDNLDVLRVFSRSCSAGAARRSGGATRGGGHPDRLGDGAMPTLGCARYAS